MSEIKLLEKTIIYDYDKGEGTHIYIIKIPFLLRLKFLFTKNYLINFKTKIK